VATPIGAQPAGFVARVTSVVVWTLDEDQFHQLTAAKRAELQQKGIQIREPERTLQSPELGLAGHWLQFKNFGPKRYPTDIDGYLHVPTIPPMTTNVPVFAQVGDKKQIGILDKITFVPEGQTPPASVLKLTYTPPVNMNPPQPPDSPSSPHADDEWAGASTARVASLGEGADSSPGLNALLQPPPPLPPHCDKRKRCAAASSTGANAAPGCCLDYDGAIGDGEPYLRSGNCGAKGYLNFLEST
jgi:hypothetical protein